METFLSLATVVGDVGVTLGDFCLRLLPVFAPGATNCRRQMVELVTLITEANRKSSATFVNNLHASK